MSRQRAYNKPSCYCKREGFDLEGYFNIKKPETDNSEADNNSVKIVKKLLLTKEKFLLVTIIMQMITQTQKMTALQFMRIG